MPDGGSGWSTCTGWLPDNGHMSSDRVSVTRVIRATPERIFELLDDPQRHPEIDGSGTVKASRGGSRRLALGDAFGMSMHWGVAYGTRNEVVALEPDRTIAWRTLGPWPLTLVATGRTWRYDLEPVEGGTRVTETWDISTEAALARPVVRRLADLTRHNMERTLERIASVVE